MADTRKKKYPLVPKGEKKCIWMQAGVVSYKICEYDLNCEDCPFDRAIRGAEAGGAFVSAFRGASTPVLEHISRFELDARRYYHPGHTWVKVESPEKVRVGLDALLVSVIGTLDALVLPLPGEKVSRCAPFGEIVQGERCFSLFSPLGGIVRAVNQKLLSSPAQLALAPLEEGWLVMVEPTDLEGDLGHCRTGRAAFSWCLKSVDWLDSAISSILEQSKTELGPTMFDGGEMNCNLRQILPSERYRRLVLRLLSAREEWWGGTEDLSPFGGENNE